MFGGEKTASRTFIKRQFIKRRSIKCHSIKSDTLSRTSFPSAYFYQVGHVIKIKFYPGLVYQVLHTKYTLYQARDFGNSTQSWNHIISMELLRRIDSEQSSCSMTIFKEAKTRLSILTSWKFLSGIQREQEVCSSPICKPEPPEQTLQQEIKFTMPKHETETLIQRYATNEVTSDDFIRGVTYSIELNV